MFQLRQMEALKRMERVLAAATERLENTESVYRKLQTQVTHCYSFKLLLVESLRDLLLYLDSRFYLQTSSYENWIYIRLIGDSKLMQSLNV